MKRYILHRLLLIFPLLLGVSLLTFTLMHLAPGDPIATQFGLNPRGMEQETVKRLRVELGIDDPLPVQYLRYLGRLLQGDLGTSLTTRMPVSQEILARVPATLQLAGAAIVLVLLCAVPLGILSAVKRGSPVDGLCWATALVGMSTPSFWLGMMLMLLFALELRWLPSGGRGDGTLVNSLQSLILPALTLGIGLTGLVMRIMRASMLEVMNQNYMRTVQAKGLSPWLVLVRHGLRNALIPVVTIIAIQFAALLGGSVIVETLFAWPGIGRLAVNAVLRRDYPVVMGVALVFAGLTVLISLLADILYTVIDPRIRYGSREKADGPMEQRQRPIYVSSLWLDVLGHMRSSRLAITGAAILLILILIALMAPWIAPHSPYEMNLQGALQPPNSPGYLLGSDELGRDNLSRLIYGSRISLTVGLIVVLLAGTIGVTLGAVSGYYGGTVDNVIMRLVDVLLAFPFLVLAIVVVAVAGPSLTNTIIALGGVSWVVFARLVRGQVLSLREADFVLAARVTGARNRRIIWQHILPNCLGVVIVQATFGVASAILAIAGLSFLGMGAQPPMAEWGAMLSAAKPYMRQRPLMAIAPGTAILITVLAIHLVGDALRDALDPRFVKAQG